MARRFLVSVVCVLLVSATTLQAQDAPPRGRPGGRGGGGGGAFTGNPEDITTRTYNVSDLLRPTGDYPLEKPIQIVAGEIQRPAPQVRSIPAIDMDSLILMLQTTVSRDSWADNGGAIGRMSQLGSMLVITQQNQTHIAINQLLSDIRRNAGPNNAVNIRATWVQTDARQLLSPTAEVNDEWMAKQKTYCESQITCFSGQIVHYTSGLDKGYISDLTPIVGTNAVAFDPSIGIAPTGVKMQISPQLIPAFVSADGGEVAILDVQAEVTEAAVQSPPAQVMSMASPANGSNQTSTASVDRVNVIRQEFKTTTRIPLRKKIIIGGMTLEPASGEQSGRQLYLIVEIDTIK